jgi:hypothetical protein
MATFDNITDTSRVLLTTHEEKFHSGAGTKLFFESIAVPDISAISYRVFQNYRPIYNYAAYKMDSLFVGTRFINGQLSINFRDSMYMRRLISAVDKILRGEDPAQVRDNLEKERDLEKLDNTEKEAALTRSTYSGTKIFDSDAFIEVLLNNENWEEVVSSYRKQVFGEIDQAKRRAPDNKYIPKYIGTGNVADSIILKKGFTIYLVYDIDDIWYNEMNRRDAFGTVRKELKISEARHEDKAGIERVPGTIQTLEGVRIVGGPDVETDSSGTPIQEVYSFIAENINTTVLEGR